MPFARLVGGLLLLAVLSACPGREESDGPVLPSIELPSTTAGLAYEATLTATGGVPPLRYSVGEVPPGFSFYSATGLLTGPATAAGEYTLSVGVKDAEGQEDSRTYTLQVYAAPEVLSVRVPQATQGASYAFQFSATGGQPPLRWTLADGSLPSGMTLSAVGDLSGVPRGAGGYPFLVRVQDANGAQATRQFALEVHGTGTDGGTDGGTGGPDAGAPFPLSVGNWNIEWFGSTTAGPTDETLQFNNVRAVLVDAGVDVWALEEIVNAGTLAQLKDALPGYDGFAANDPRVRNGSTHYSAGEQKLAVLFKSDTVQVLDAEVILGDYTGDFAGRPPLRLDLRVTRNGTSVDLVAIVLHMKAETSGGRTDYDRRTDAGVALKQYLDTQLSTARVIVLGDWNDDVDVSITKDTSGSYLPSPYQNFVDVPAEYTFLTRPLSLRGERSTVSNSNVIDHQLVSNELAVSHVSNSTLILRPSIPSYGSTTSDHYPVLSHFDFGRLSLLP